MSRDTRSINNVEVRACDVTERHTVVFGGAAVSGVANDERRNGGKMCLGVLDRRMLSALPVQDELFPL